VTAGGAKRAHRMPFGAELEDGRVRFRLWAPGARTVGVKLIDAARVLAMQQSDDGWFELRTEAARAGHRYRYVIDDEIDVPDPAARFQPEDVHGPSEIIDAAAFDWADGEWRGRPWEETVLYELHVGTYTPEGTYEGVVRRLDHLVDLGVTALELMPLAESPGAHNWGYDGVYPFAPEGRYGRPEDLKALIQAAHRRGLMVFHDVVYNHFGPEGNYLHRYAPQFFTDRHKTPWGAAINFDGPGSRTVRDFFIHNALYWIEEFGFDGLRFDAVHAIMDDSRPDILTELGEAVAATVGRARRVHLVLENDDNAARYLERDAAGRPRWYVAQWNDDAHHVLHVLATGETSGYYGDYAGGPVARLGRVMTEGFAYQGEPSVHRGGQRRGEPSAQLPPTAFVSFLQNHDQIGNRAFGERITRLAEPAAVRAAVAIYLLAPSPPLLFMGEEWAAEQPFCFFCDFGGDLAESVRAGRRNEFARFPEFSDPAARARIPDPMAAETFAASLLDWTDLRRPAHREWLDFYKALLHLRHGEIIPRLRGVRGGAASYRVDAERVLTASWRLDDGSALRLVANPWADPWAGAELHLPGRLLYATDPEAAARQPLRDVPAWFVAWSLEAPTAAP